MSTFATLSRRSVLAGATATLAAPSISGAGGARGDGNLAGFIAAYRKARADQRAACDLICELYSATDLPEIAVRYGRRKFHDKETGEVTWGQWVFESDFEVERYFRPIIDFWTSPNWCGRTPSGLLADYERVMSEVRAAQDRRDEIEQAAGITAAQHASDLAGEEVFRIRADIFAHRPVSLGEVDIRNAFILEMQRTHGDVRDHLETIFGGGPAGEGTS